MSIRILQTQTTADEPVKSADVMAIKDLLRRGALVAAGEVRDDTPGVVRNIIDQVARRGDEAVIELTERIDGIRLAKADLSVSADRIAKAHKEADPEFLALARRVIANIRSYQQHIMVKTPPDLVRGGRRLGVRYTPMDSVGVYVPGRKAIYPSSVLMTVVPAQVAGVKDIVIAAPPTADAVNDMTLALAAELEIDTVYRVGGAIAVAALAIGTESIDAVQMVAGPGNAYVAEAKMQVCGRVAIDSPAGASEVLIIADDSADPAWLAADMLAQAEHNPASSVMVTDSLALAEAVQKQMDSQVSKLERSNEIRHAIDHYSAIIVVRTMRFACELANYFAPEHLQIVTRNDGDALSRIRHAGAVFLGANTPVPLGDYVAGPSHVLPTRGRSRQFSALSVNSFLTASSVLSYDAEALAADAADVQAFAAYEGLTAHAAAVEVRLGKQVKSPEMTPEAAEKDKNRRKK